MSTFVFVTRYDEAGPEGGEILDIDRDDIEAAISSLRNFELFEEDGDLGVKLPGLPNPLVKDGAGLSCQLDHQTDTDHLLEVLREFASKIPGAVVEDEEGETY